MDNPEDLAVRIYQLCLKLKKQRPLIHVVTNFVVMNQTANVLLAMGAAPTMSWAREDLEYISGISDGLCVNIGTPTSERVEAMATLMELAEASDKPLVLDPVGSGAGPYRTQIARRLLSLAPHKIIRGNTSELYSLTDDQPSPRGENNTISAAEAKKILINHGRTGDHTAGRQGMGMELKGGKLLTEHASCLLVNGQEDLITDASQALIFKNGSSLMSAVTGTGCILSAMTAAFYAVSQTPFEAAAAACAVAGISGELAAEKSAGPGTFLSNFIDVLYTLDLPAITSRLNAEYITL